MRKYECSILKKRRRRYISVKCVYEFLVGNGVSFKVIENTQEQQRHVLHAAALD